MTRWLPSLTTPVCPRTAAPHRGWPIRTAGSSARPPPVRSRSASNWSPTMRRWRRTGGCSARNPGTTGSSAAPPRPGKGHGPRRGPRGGWPWRWLTRCSAGGCPALPVAADSAYGDVTAVRLAAWTDAEDLAYARHVRPQTTVGRRREPRHALAGRPMRLPAVDPLRSGRSTLPPCANRLGRARSSWSV